MAGELRAGWRGRGSVIDARTLAEAVEQASREARYD